MDQPRPRHPALITPIIERPDLQSSGQRVLYGTLTSLCWLVWLHLWLPALTILARTIEVEAAEKDVLIFEAFDNLVLLLSMYHLPVLLSMGLLAWAAYNTVRFGDVERRRGALRVSAAAVCRHFGTELALMSRWQGARSLYVSHDADGRVTAVETVETVEQRMGLAS